ncbi:MAG: methyl-accepting chemotaxis protein [Planctomycetes bacterium]|nr:methyl-accepting chemotaxis protein [Planctomycetota bacterium]
MFIWNVRRKIVAASAVALAASIGVCSLYGALKLRTEAEAKALDGLDSAARDQGTQLRRIVSEAVQVANTLADTFSAVKDENSALDLPREAAIGILRTTLTRHEECVAVGTAWEPEAYDGMDSGYKNTPGHDDTGRFAPVWCRTKADAEPELLATSGIDLGQAYERAKTSRHVACEIVAAKGDVPSRLVIFAPIVTADTFHGGTMILMDLSFADQLLAADGKDRFFLDETGAPFAASGNVADIERMAADAQLQEALTTGEASELRHEEHVVRLVPIRLGHNATTWWSGVQILRSSYTAAASAVLWNGLGLGLLISLVAIAMLWWLAGRIAQPLANTVTRLKDIASGGGDLTSELPVVTKDEVGQVAEGFNSFQWVVRGLLKEVANTSDAIRSGTEGMSAASLNLSQLSQDAALSVRAATDQLGQFVNLTKTTSEHAGKARNLADSSVGLVDRGLGDMGELQQAMQQVLPRESA